MVSKHGGILAGGECRTSGSRPPGWTIRSARESTVYGKGTTSSRAAKSAEFGSAPIRRNYPGCRNRSTKVHLAARVKLVPFPQHIPTVPNPNAINQDG